MKFSKPVKLRSKKPYKKPLRKSSKSSTVSLAVKKYVKRTVHANVENKCVQINGGYSFGNVNESPDFNAYPMCPLNAFWTIPLGTGQGSRIGNSISVRKVMLNYVLRPTIYDITANPLPEPTEVQLLLGYVKLTPGTLPVAGDISKLFQAGSSVAAPAGSLRDLISIINTDYWVIKKKWTHKLGYADYTGTGNVPAGQYRANNDFHMNVVKKLDITKYIPKHISFNDSDTTALSKNLFFMQQAVASSGGTFGATTLQSNIEFWIDFQYEDA